MNRRIVLIDQNETPNVASFYGIGLGDEIYTLQALTQMNPDDLRNFMMSLGKGDAIMLVGGEPFKFLQQFRHPGVRSENYFDCSKLYRLSWEGDLYTKIVLETPEPQEVQEFMSPDFTRDVDFSWFKSKVIHDFQGAMKFLDWLDNLPEDEDLAADIEASGFPMDKWYEWSGVSICNKNFGGFISFTDIRLTDTEENYNILLKKLAGILEKRMSHIWVFNCQYEFLAFHRMLGIDLYNLCDAGVYNILDGYHRDKKYSLKWTAQRILKAKVWDTEFDWISDTIDSMLYMVEGKLKKDKHKVLKVTPDNYQQTEEWKALCNRYPNYIDEFEKLMSIYFGNPFLVVPSEILGTYCNLDAFYTLMIHLTEKPMYTDKAREVFLDNLRLAARLHSCGMPKNEEYRKEYEQYCLEQSAFGITYEAMARCFIKMEKHRKLMAKIDKYSNIAKKLLYENKFFNGNPIEITKYILVNNVDELDTYELGLNEGKLLMEFGPEFTEKFIEYTREAMEGCEMIKLYKKTGEKVLKKKIDSTVGGKKKLIQLLSEKIIPLIGLDKIKINNKHIELEKYLYYERAYNELSKVVQTQVGDIYNIPKEIVAFGKKMSLLEYNNFIVSEYFKCSSPLENDEIAKEFTELFKTETIFLATIFTMTQQLPNAEKYYSDLGIKTIEDAYSHFMKNWEAYVKSNGTAPTDYLEAVYMQASSFYKDITQDPVKDVWTSFDGYHAESQFFSYVDDQYLEYEKPFDPCDLNNTWFFHRKMTINYLRYKKYEKIRSTYICGLFEATDKWVQEDPNSHVVIRECDKNEPGAIQKMFAHFACMEKQTKRWSSGYHTIISKSDIKSTICSYPGHLLSYFDINKTSVT